MTLIRSDLPSKPMPGKLGHDDVPVLDLHAVREAAIGLEQVRIALVAAEAEAGRDVERHLVAAMRDAAGGRPAELRQHVEGAQVLDQAVGQGAVELQPVAVRPHAAVAQEVAGVLVREQVLAGGHRARIEFRDRRLQGVVEGVADLLVPEQRVLPQHLGVGDAGLEVEASVHVDGELRLRADLRRAPPRCGADPPRSGRRRSSSSRRCSRGRGSRASRRAAACRPCPGSSSRRPRRRRRAGWPRCPSARRASGTAACRRSWPSRPRSPCRGCRPPPSVRRDRRASRWSSSPPRACAGRGCRRPRSGRSSDRPPGCGS